ncbi:hypothetical protein L6R52_02595 [Myxococcota bacterium]|nr:hypothetical protein [Myxococcota bacterium]
MRAAFVSTTLLFTACGGAETPEPGSKWLPVRFEYRASTTVDTAVVGAHRGCAEIVGPTHIHLGWRSFSKTDLRAEGPELWALDTLAPAGQHAIRVSDANVCDENETGAVTARVVYANGVLLTRVVSTPGDGPEPGFSFSLDDEGVAYP